MATATLRPNGTVSTTGAAVIGAANAHTALSDDSDSSYVDLIASTAFVVNLTDAAIPAGAVVKSVAVRLRTKRFGSFSSLCVATLDLEGDPSGQTIVTWVNPTVHTLFVSSASYADAEIDAATLEVAAPDEAGATLRVIEAFVDVVYVPKPVVNVLTPTGTLTEDNMPTVTWEWS